MEQTFNMPDLGRLVGGEWQLACGRWQVADKVGQWLIRKDDGLYLTDPENTDALWKHPGDDGLVLPSVFTLEQFKAFCDWHPTFEWEAITSVFTNDDGTLDTGALEELDSRGAAAGILVRCILGIADAEYLQAWEQQCAIDEVQTKIREITALKAMTIAEIQYRDGRLKELSDELARLQQPAPDQTAATPAPVAATTSDDKKWTPKKLAELQAYRDVHTMRETETYYGISGARIRKLLPSKKPKATPFAGLIHRAK